MAINLQAEVNALVAKIDAEAADEHERAVMLFATKAAFETLWSTAAIAADEARAHLVLEKRAVESGKSIDEQKADVALLLKKHPSTVTAIECLNVKMLREPEPPRTPEAPASGGK